MLKLRLSRKVLEIYRKRALNDYKQNKKHEIEVRIKRNLKELEKYDK
jgi:hypothetical protein